MSLVLLPNPDGSADDYHVMQGGWQVGRIYKRRDALREETRWLWIITCISRGPGELRLTGMNATLDDALAAMKKTWGTWLAWAELAEAKPTADPVRAPQVLSVVISKSDRETP
jgi:hypothetical protein